MSLKNRLLSEKCKKNSNHELRTPDKKQGLIMFLERLLLMMVNSTVHGQCEVQYFWMSLAKLFFQKRKKIHINIFEFSFVLNHRDTHKCKEINKQSNNKTKPKPQPGSLKPDRSTTRNQFM